MSINHNSEVARFRQQQALEEEAARLGLYGLASGIARHDFINKRMEQGAERVLRLIEAGKHQEAQALMATDAWGVAEQERPNEQAHLGD